MIRLYTDTAVNGNPGSAGVGLLIVKENEQHQITIPLDGQWNNHHAEFKAVSLGLSWLIENNYTNEMTFCYTDSQIVAQSVEKEHVKDPIAQKYLKEILEMMAQFKIVTIEWIPENQNKGADNLARQALQKTLRAT
ncbi:MAG TPA: ribonuclease HI family protein [Atopostipes sp.]|nr:ribonuclease HI family protein [Atopostipes sp.]